MKSFFGRAPAHIREQKQVPPRFELGSLDSESRVLTITPWNHRSLGSTSEKRAAMWLGGGVRSLDPLDQKTQSWLLCRNPGSNQGPLDLQSNALPTELFRPGPCAVWPAGISVRPPVTCEKRKAEGPREQNVGPYGDRTRDLGVISTTL